MNLIITLLMAFYSSTDKVGSIKLIDARFPTYAATGQSVTLTCEFQLAWGERVYSSNWYYDGQEFYRFYPSENPPDETFYHPHFHVDQTLSNMSTVVLHQLSLDASGTYRCEISTESPYFNTISYRSPLIVADIPESGPTMDGIKERYEVGDRIVATCRLPTPRPQPSFSWYINGEEVRPDRIHLTRTSDETAGDMMTSRLSFRLKSKHLENHRLTIKCVASLANFYWISDEKILLRYSHSVVSRTSSSAPLCVLRKIMRVFNRRGQYCFSIRARNINSVPMAKTGYVFNSMSFIPNNQHSAMDKIVGKRNSARYSRIPIHIVTGKSQDFHQTVVGNQQQSKSSRDKGKCLAGFDGIVQSTTPAIKSSVWKNSGNNDVSIRGSRYVKRIKKPKSDHNSKFRKWNARISKHINRWMNDVDKEISNILNQPVCGRQTKDLIRITGEIKKNFAVVLDRIEKFPLLSEKQTEKFCGGAVKSSLGGNSRGRHHDKIAMEVVQRNQKINKNTRLTYLERIKQDSQRSSISQSHEEKSMRATNINGKSPNNNVVDNGVRVRSPLQKSSEGILQNKRKFSDGRTNLYQCDNCKHFLANNTRNASSESHQMIDRDLSLALSGKRVRLDGAHEKDSLEHSKKETPSERLCENDNIECSTKVPSSVKTYYTDSLDSSVNVHTSHTDFDKDSLNYYEERPLSEILFEIDSLDCPMKGITTNDTYERDSLNYSEVSLSEKLYETDSLDCPVKGITTCEIYDKDSLDYYDKVSFSEGLYEIDSLDCPVKLSTYKNDSLNHSEEKNVPECLYETDSLDCPVRVLTLNETYEKDSLDCSEKCEGLYETDSSDCPVKGITTNQKCKKDSLNYSEKSLSEALYETDSLNCSVNEHSKNGIYGKYSLECSRKYTSSADFFEVDGLDSLTNLDLLSLRKSECSVISERGVSSDSKYETDSSKYMRKMSTTKVNNMTKYKDRLEEIYKTVSHSTSETPILIESDTDYRDSSHGASTVTLVSESEDSSESKCWETFGRPTFTKLFGDRLHDRVESPLSRYETSSETLISECETNPGTVSSESLSGSTFIKLNGGRFSKTEETASLFDESNDSSEYIDLDDSGTVSLESLSGSTFTILNGGRFSKTEETVSPFNESIDNSEYIDLDDSGTFSDLSVWLESDTDHISSPNEAFTDTLTSYADSLNELSF